MAFIVVAFIVMAYIVMAYTVMAYIVMAYTVMAYKVMAYTAMAYKVMAYTVMADVGVRRRGLPLVPTARHGQWRLCRPRRDSQVPHIRPGSVLRRTEHTHACIRACAGGYHGHQAMGKKDKRAFKDSKGREHVTEKRGRRGTWFGTYKVASVAADAIVPASTDVGEASKCKATVPSEVLAGDEVRFDIEIRTKKGKPTDEADGNAVAEYEDVDEMIEIEPSRSAVGMHHGQFTPYKSGRVRLDILVEGEHVGGGKDEHPKWKVYNLRCNFENVD